MASAQVLSNSSNSSRKQEQLEAGKRRLEEFRKKKAADRAKKAAATSQPQTVESTAHEKQTLENGQARIVDSDGAGTSGRAADGSVETSGIQKDNKLHGFLNDIREEITPPTHVDFGNDLHLSQTHPKQEYESDFTSGLKYQLNLDSGQQAEEANGNFGGDSEGKRCTDGILSDHSKSYDPPAFRDNNSGYNHSNLYGVEESTSNRTSGSLDIAKSASSGVYDIGASAYFQGPSDNLLQNKSDSFYPAVSFTASASNFELSRHGALELHNQTMPRVDEGKFKYVVSPLPNSHDQSLHASDMLSTGSSTHVSEYAGEDSAQSELYPKRSRPSFLDSLNIPRAPATSGFPYYERERFELTEATSTDSAVSSTEKSFADAGTVKPPLKLGAPTSISNFTASTVGNVNDSYMKSKEEFYSQKQNEDFAALEQHIEDLTQEKFSLQRALEASKAVAELLSAENSQLTESYNQQANFVNQLKEEMEKLQEEIKLRLVELESIRAEYTNAQLECTAADERAKLLASEVIGLEEKALRLRSNELKLERELEKSNTEIASYKKTLSSLEKDRRDLQQTIDALQEEKKMLQSKLRKASSVGSPIDLSKAHPKKEASTCTDDLGADEATSVHANYRDSVPVTFSPELHDAASGFDVPITIPPDQGQMIQNIKSLIAELMAEKEELVQALVTESSMSSKLKDMNKELSQKLEVQTQRLELLTAQSMAAGENIPARQPSGSHVVQETVAYADEGDEVVERVLGWIMKLFPGGPSKRRSSKLI